MNRQLRPSFVKKLALVAAVVSGNTFLCMFIVAFVFHNETIWDTENYRYIVPAVILVLTLLWQFAFRAKRKNNPAIDQRVWYFGIVLVRYCLAVVLMLYAFAKFTDGQFARNFSDAEVTLSQASGLKLAWAFFGHSFVYSSFIGGTQILCALLLFSRRTVLLASVILLPILANILLMDLTHHITAEDIAGTLLYMVLFLFLLHFDRLKAFFITHERIEPQDTSAPWRIGGRQKTWLKLVAVTVCIAYPAYQNYAEMQAALTKLPIKGAWIATQEYRGKDSLSQQVQLDTIHTRLYVEDYLEGTLISGGKKQFYFLVPDSTGNGITLNFVNKDIQPIKGTYHMQPGDRFVFTGRQGADSIRYVFQRRKMAGKQP